MQLRVYILEAVQIKLPLESEMLHHATSAHQLAGLCHHSTGSHFKQLFISDFSRLRCCLVSLVSYSNYWTLIEFNQCIPLKLGSFMDFPNLSPNLFGIQSWHMYPNQIANPNQLTIILSDQATSFLFLPFFFFLLFFLGFFWSGIQ